MATLLTKALVILIFAVMGENAYDDPHYVNFCGRNYSECNRMPRGDGTCSDSCYTICAVYYGFRNGNCVEDVERCRSHTMWDEPTSFKCKCWDLIPTPAWRPRG
ncbi:unnamed protein product [Lymnaea stagnalis]|uniref:Uncharacterized protein n=1 Tax=Lymnaea stagnalis TaxID=6523 RepID=A0AAV2HRG8_LYMST